MINVLLRAFFIQEGLKCEKQKSKQVCRESSWCRSIAARADCTKRICGVRQAIDSGNIMHE